MELLVVEPLDPEVLDWLSMRHAVVYAPHLAHDPYEFRASLARVRGMVLPPSVAVDRAVLRAAPQLLTVGRLSAGAENLDLESCARAGVEVVRPATASANAEAEFAIGALLQMLRRVPVINAEGLAVGRELGGSVVGIVGMTPAARPLATLLDTFGARVIGYDPAVHAGDGLWDRWGVEPVPLRQLMEQSDSVCVLLSYYSRYHGLLGQRYLAECKPNQVLVSLAPSGLFDEGRWPMRWPRGAWPRPGSTAWSPARLARAGRCTTSTTCRSRRAWPAPRASRACAAPGPWPSAWTRSFRRGPRCRTSRRRHQAR
jgi:D-3-phosphoglycerate dehydrogenase